MKIVKFGRNRADENCKFNNDDAGGNNTNASDSGNNKQGISVGKQVNCKAMSDPNCSDENCKIWAKQGECSKS